MQFNIVVAQFYPNLLRIPVISMELEITEIDAVGIKLQI